MSIADAVSRISQIESQIVQLTAPAPTSSDTATTETSATDDTSFANTLDAASGQMVTPSAGQMVDNGTTGADIVADAQQYIGVPYVFGGTTTSGMDCSGLVQRVYEDNGIQLPRLVSGQSTIGESVPSLADAEPGDIISCDGGNHIVIYAGNGMIIQAPKPGGQVEEVPNWITQSNVVSIRRIVPSTTDTSTPAATDSTASASELSQLASLLGTQSSSSSSTDSLLTSLLGSSSTNPEGLSTIAALLAGSTESSALSAMSGSDSTSSSSILGSGTTNDSLLFSLLAGGSTL